MLSDLSDPVDVPVVIVVWFPPNSGDPGDTVRVPICVANARGLSANGIDIEFLYDPATVDSYVVKQTAITRHADFSAGGQDGRIKITSVTTVETDALLGEGSLFDIYLHVRTDAASGSGEMILNQVKFFRLVNETPEALPVSFGESQLLCVSQNHMMGDLDADRDLTSADVLTALGLAVRLKTPEDWQEVAGDLNGDRTIDSADAVMIQRIASLLAVNPEPGAKSAFEEDRKQGATRKLQVAQVQANPGERKTVPVTLEGAKDVAGIDAVFSFPPELEFISVDLGTLTKKFAIEKSAGGSGGPVQQLRVSLSSRDALTAASGQVLTLTFKVSDAISGQAILPIRINEVRLKGVYGESYDWYSSIWKVDGDVTVGASLEGEGEGEGEGQGGEGEGEGQPNGCNCPGLKEAAPGAPWNPAYAGDGFTVFCAIAALTLAGRSRKNKR